MLFVPCLCFIVLLDFSRRWPKRSVNWRGWTVEVHMGSAQEKSQRGTSARQMSLDDQLSKRWQSAELKNKMEWDTMIMIMIPLRSMYDMQPPFASSRSREPLTKTEQMPPAKVSFPQGCECWPQIASKVAVWILYDSVFATFHGSGDWHHADPWYAWMPWCLQFLCRT